MKFSKHINPTKIIICILALLIAIISFSVLKVKFTNPSTYSSQIKVLDEKKNTAMAITAGLAVTSTAISALPDDTATPVATKISDLTTPMLLIVCMIYLEKFLLTTVGYLSFGILIPISMLIFIGFTIINKKILLNYSTKLLIFAISIFCLIPASIGVTKLIDETFENSIKTTYESVYAISDAAQKSAEDKDSKGFLDFITSIDDKVKDIAESAKNVLSTFIDAIAVLFITTCAIPVLVFLCFLLLLKQIFNINIELDKIALTYAKVIAKNKTLLDEDFE